MEVQHKIIVIIFTWKHSRCFRFIVHEPTLANTDLQEHDAYVTCPICGRNYLDLRSHYVVHYTKHIHLYKSSEVQKEGESKYPWANFKKNYNIVDKKARKVPKIINNQYIVSIQPLNERQIPASFDVLIDEAEIESSLEYLRNHPPLQSLRRISRIDLDISSAKKIQEAVGDTFSNLLSCTCLRDMEKYINVTEEGLDDHLVRFEKSVEETTKAYLGETKKDSLSYLADASNQKKRGTDDG
jgi:hypothetical protein